MYRRAPLVFSSMIVGETALNLHLIHCKFQAQELVVDELDETIGSRLEGELVEGEQSYVQVRFLSGREDVKYILEKACYVSVFVSDVVKGVPFAVTLHFQDPAGSEVKFFAGIVYDSGSEGAGFFSDLPDCGILVYFQEGIFGIF